MSPELELAIKTALRALEFHRDSWQDHYKSPYSDENSKEVYRKLMNNDETAIETLKKEFNLP